MKHSPRKRCAPWGLEFIGTSKYLAVCVQEIVRDLPKERRGIFYEFGAR